MFSYILRKLFSTLASILLIFTLAFIMFRLLPGDPVSLMFRDPRLTREQIDYLMREFGLNKPLWEQYFIYLLNAFRGNLGISFYYKQPVNGILIERLVNTLILLIPSTLCAILLGVVTGSISAWKNNKAIDKIITSTSLVLYTLPTYWLGGLLIILSITYLKLPVTGMYNYGVQYGSYIDRLLDLFSHMTLPFITLTLVSYGSFTVIIRSALVDISTEDFVKASYAMGFSEKRIFLKILLKNVSLPILSMSAIAIGTSVAGAVLTETVFAWPGVGRLIYDAVINRDYPLLQGSFLVISVSVVLANMIADLLYGVLDPRVRTS
ncbi:MAG: ABC transporter permease [Desulfurococcaceae archaeon]